MQQDTQHVLLDIIKKNQVRKIANLALVEHITQGMEITNVITVEQDIHQAKLSLQQVAPFVKVAIMGQRLLTQYV